MVNGQQELSLHKKNLPIFTMFKCAVLESICGQRFILIHLQYLQIINTSNTFHMLTITEYCSVFSKNLSWRCQRLLQRKRREMGGINIFPYKIIGHNIYSLTTGCACWKRWWTTLDFLLFSLYCAWFSVLWN